MPTDKELSAACAATTDGHRLDQIIARGLMSLQPQLTDSQAITRARTLLASGILAASQVGVRNAGRGEDFAHRF